MLETRLGSAPDVGVIYHNPVVAVLADSLVVHDLIELRRHVRAGKRDAARVVRVAQHHLRQLPQAVDDLDRQPRLFRVDDL